MLASIQETWAIKKSQRGLPPVQRGHLSLRYRESSHGLYTFVIDVFTRKTKHKGQTRTNETLKIG
jgi:hypothetical protein